MLTLSLLFGLKFKIITRRFAFIALSRATTNIVQCLLFNIVQCLSGETLLRTEFGLLSMQHALRHCV